MLDFYVFACVRLAIFHNEPTCTPNIGGQTLTEVSAAIHRTYAYNRDDTF
jgi:hypothetical protein